MSIQLTKYKRPPHSDGVHVIYDNEAFSTTANNSNNNNNSNDNDSNSNNGVRRSSDVVLNGYVTKGVRAGEGGAVQTTTSSIPTVVVHSNGGGGGRGEQGGNEIPLTVTTTRTMTSAEKEGASLVFKNVCVTLSKKLILNKVSGLAKIGQTLAIMGPSGAGKSTLLNALTGRVPASSGSITLNGEPVDRHMRRKISYVQQQDVFYPNLTLKESLTFTTYLRLPDSMPKELKLRRMQETVDALELNKCLNTKWGCVCQWFVFLFIEIAEIGGTFVTGLSGGERKRASIACELLTNPRIIILDEPTSGLDSAIAYSLMSTLSKYARQSRKTVVTTIHQPSSQIFHMFTNVLLLHDGQVAYFGAGSKIIEFFASLSLPCDSLYNPADFILEKVKSGPEIVAKIMIGAQALRQKDTWPEELREYDDEEKEGQRGGGGGGRRLSKGARDRPVPRSEVKVIHGEPSEEEKTSISTQEVDVDLFITEGAKWQTSFMTQFLTLTRRGFVQSRSRFLSPLYLGPVLILAILAGLEWFQTPRLESRAQDRLGILFFVTVQFAFIPIMDAIFQIYDASGVFIRERSSGVFRLSSFYCAKMLSELPMTVIGVIVFTIIIYWMTSLEASAGNFFAHLGVLLLNALTAQSMGFFIGVVVTNKSFVVPIANLITIASLLTGGFYNTNVVAWFYWFRYLSYMTYTLTALARIEFEYGSPLACNPPNSTIFPAYCHNATSECPNLPCSVPGLVFLEHQNFTSIPLYAALIVLAGLVVLFRISAYIVLRLTQPKA